MADHKRSKDHKKLAKRERQENEAQEREDTIMGKKRKRTRADSMDEELPPAKESKSS